MSSKWVTVARTVWPHEAHMLAGMLRDHEVDAVVADEYMVQMEGFASYALGGVKVKVREQDVERARALLSETEGDASTNGHISDE